MVFREGKCCFNAHLYKFISSLIILPTMLKEIQPCIYILHNMQCFVWLYITSVSFLTSKVSIKNEWEVNLVYIGRQISPKHLIIPTHNTQSMCAQVHTYRTNISISIQLQACMNTSTKTHAHISILP